MEWAEYTWIVVVSVLAAFFTAYGIGANDVANAFGSSVAARTLTMRQALLIAAVCEFSGAVLLGSEVTRTVASGIARLVVFEREPEIYMYGMLCSLAASGAWLLLATYLSLPVSTTHATVGGVLGFAFVYGGRHAVVWLEPQEGFPYMGGLVPIVLAWFTSPLLSGVASTSLFLLVRTAILRRENSLQLALWSLPLLVLVTVFINLFFVLYKGSEARLTWDANRCAWVSAAAAGGCSLLTALIGLPFVRRRVYEAALLRRKRHLAQMARASSPQQRDKDGDPEKDREVTNQESGKSPARGSHSHSLHPHPHHSLNPQHSHSHSHHHHHHHPQHLARTTGGASPAVSPSDSLTRDAQLQQQQLQQSGGLAAGNGGVMAGGGGGGRAAPGLMMVSPFARGSATAGSMTTMVPVAMGVGNAAGAGVAGATAAGGEEQLGTQQQQQQESGQQQQQLLQQVETGNGMASSTVPSGSHVDAGSQQLQLQQWSAGQQVPGHEAGYQQQGQYAAAGQYWQQQQQAQQQYYLPQQPYDQQQQYAWQVQGQGWQQQQQQQGWQHYYSMQQQQPQGQQQQQQQAIGGVQFQYQPQFYNNNNFNNSNNQYWDAQQQQQQPYDPAWSQQQQWQLQQQQQQQLQGGVPAAAAATATDEQQQPVGAPSTHTGPGPIAEAVEEPEDLAHLAHLARMPQGPGPVAEAVSGGSAGGGLGTGSWPLTGVATGAHSSAHESGYGVGGGGGGVMVNSGGGGGGGGGDGDGGSDGDDDGGQQQEGSSEEGGSGGSADMHWQKTFDQLKAVVLHGTNVDIHSCLEEGGDEVAAAIHAQAEVFDPSTEHAFKYLQVVTAICDSFSHGANDVANSVGPLAAVWAVYRHMRVDYDSTLPVWILILGGAGIVVGLATYGYNIIRAIGVRLSVITPARGFCIELSTALVVVLASKYGLPISTTHCQVGATAGMGLIEGSSGVNWRLSLQFLAGWVVTMLITGLLSAGMFAAGAYAPSVQQGRQLRSYQDALADVTSRLDLLLNRTNTAALSDPTAWGTYSPDLAAALAADFSALQLQATRGSSTATRPVQHVTANEMTQLLGRALDTYLNNSFPYIGGVQARDQA
ncbi:hypothetical protein Agub_g7931 [Astrephomene gubernaculifera]|uniref:Phosphate transporter n=1 Tax=Astrephomene gubernaculifera TaxID=47775 RepID=A0AAD3DQZ2_9CHLO|nr:hypothetical protein Agub_g7931 [Astrephomene gubernaculifera]